MARTLKIVSSILLLAGIYTMAAAQEAALPAGLKACTSQKDDAQRLACYDAELAKWGSKPSSPNSTASNAANKPNTAASEFGVENGPLARAKSEAAPHITKLTAKVTAVSKTGTGALLISLDNDQVWQQTRMEAYFPLKKDDTVELSAGLMGVYWLEAPSGRATKVKRIK